MEAALIQGTEAWLALRRTHIGSSDIPIILGISPWSTPLQLYQRKKGLTPEQTSNAAMTRGTGMEEQARQWFEERTQKIMFPCVRFHEEHKFLMASLDGMTMEGDAIVEIKCPGKATHSLALQGKLPEHYMAQVQHQLLVTGLPMAYYCSYDGIDGVIIEVRRDEFLIQRILDESTKFFECMINDTPPAPCSKDYSEIMIEKSQRDVIENWRKVKGQLKELEEIEADLKKSIVDMGDGGNFCLAEGEKTIVTATKVVRDGIIDWKTLCTDLGIPDSQVNLYRKPGMTYYKLSM